MGDARLIALVRTHARPPVWTLAVGLALLFPGAPALAAAAMVSPAPGEGSSEAVSISTAGPTASLTIVCPAAAAPAGAPAAPAAGAPAAPAAGAPAACIGHMRLSAHVRRRGNRVIAVSVSGGAREAVGGSGYTVPAGASVTVVVRLNKLGRQLLARFYELPASAAFTGSPTLARRIVDFSYSRIHPTFAYSWSFTPAFSRLSELTISGMPAGARVLVSCNGPGCPFRRLSLAPPASSASLEYLFAGSKLEPGAVVWFAVSAPDVIGEVAVFQVHAGTIPTETFRCLPPGAAAPTKCVK